MPASERYYDLIEIIIDGVYIIDPDDTDPDEIAEILKEAA